MIRLRCFLGRRRQRIALAAVLAALCVALSVEHSGLGVDRMGDLASMCLAVLDGAAVLLLSAVGLAAVRRPRPPVTILAAAPLALTPPPIAPPPARDGPILLQVFRR